MIGAGMLAMPLTSAGIGLTATVFLLLAYGPCLLSPHFYSWNCIKPLTAMRGSAHLLHNILVKQGRIISTAVLIVFLYALIAAYVVVVVPY